MDRRLLSCLLATTVAVGLGLSTTPSGAAPRWFRNPFRKSDAAASSGPTTSGQLAQGIKRVPPARGGLVKKLSGTSATSPTVNEVETTKSAATASPAKIRWQTDLKEARAISLRENRPLLIMFSAEWCTFCHKLERQTLSDPELVAYINSKFVPVKLDVEEHKRIAAILEVESLPASVVLSPKADLLGTITGYFEKSEYQASLKDALALDKKMQQAAAVSGP